MILSLLISKHNANTHISKQTKSVVDLWDHIKFTNLLQSTDHGLLSCSVLLKTKMVCYITKYLNNNYNIRYYCSPWPRTGRVHSHTKGSICMH